MVFVYISNFSSLTALEATMGGKPTSFYSPEPISLLSSFFHRSLVYHVRAYGMHLPVLDNVVHGSCLLEARYRRLAFAKDG